jgi:DNA-binding MarR family transcriptional regulator
LGLIERFEDPEDRRRRPYRLTRAGREEAKRVEAAAVVGAEAMRRLFQEIDEDLIAALEKAIERLRVQPFGERMREVEAGGTRGRARK